MKFTFIKTYMDKDEGETSEEDLQGVFDEKFSFVRHGVHFRMFKIYYRHIIKWKRTHNLIAPHNILQTTN